MRRPRRAARPCSSAPRAGSSRSPAASTRPSGVRARRARALRDDLGLHGSSARRQPCRGPPIRTRSPRACCATSRVAPLPLVQHLARFHGSDAFEVLAPAGTRTRHCSSRSPRAPPRSWCRSCGRASESGHSRPTTSWRAARRSPRSAARMRRGSAWKSSCDDVRGMSRCLTRARRTARCMLFDGARPDWVATGAARAPPDHAAPGLGRARCRRDPRVLARVHRRGAGGGRGPRGRRRRDRHRQPARDGRAVGARERAARSRNAIVWQDTRSAERVAALGLDRPLPLADGDCRSRPTSRVPSSRWLLDELPGARGRAPRPVSVSRGQHPQLARLAPGRRARDRRHQREPHAADGPAHTVRSWNDALLACDRRPAGAAGRASAPRAASSARSAGSRSRRCSAISRPRSSGSFPAASRPGEAKCTYGTGNFLLLNTGEERSRAVAARPDHRRRLPARRRTAGLHARGRRRRDGRTRAVVARQPRA